MTAYYNEIDPFAANWLRNLISAGHIPPGDVDTRSITEVSPDDLRSHTQCHFFAGIGGWSLALDLAHWNAARPVWTGSCPCQPFSEAGKQKGQSDERHLWPIWFSLIRECQPPVIFGEQVSDAIAFSWLDEAACNLEKEDYAMAAAVLPACSVGAPHRRERLFFVAHALSSDSTGWNENRRRRPRSQDLGKEWAYANWNSGPGLAHMLDDGISGRLAKRIANGFGNAIVPQLAAEFITAYIGCQP